MTWPVTDAPYGSLSWLRRELGGYLDYGWVYEALTHEQQGRIDSVIRSGMNRVYFPPPFEGQPVPHKWSFLSPTRSLTTVASDADYDLPLDCTGIVGDFTYQSTTETYRIPVVPEVQLRQIRANAAQSGSPRVVAIRPRVDANTQVLEAIFYPTPDAALTLEYRSTIVPGLPEIPTMVPVGGIQHAELFKAGCMAVAEEQATKNPAGPWNLKFMELLKAAIQVDAVALQTTSDGVWQTEDQPVGMGLNRSRLRQLIGKERGYGQHTRAWTHNQAQDVERDLETGMRRFYNPLAVDDMMPHEWSFLTPTFTIKTKADEYILQLPSDFAQMAGSITHSAESSIVYTPIELVGEEQIRYRLQESGSSGRPQLAALRSRPADEQMGGTVWELMLWPIPDGVWTLSARYRVNASSLFNEQQEPYGGQQHFETIIESCLAAAEMSMGKPGKHAEAFRMLLRTSVKRDQKAFSPQTYGYMYDPSDRPEYDCGVHGEDGNVVSYNGTIY